MLYALSRFRPKAPVLNLIANEEISLQEFLEVASKIAALQRLNPSCSSLLSA